MKPVPYQAHRYYQIFIALGGFAVLAFGPFTAFAIEDMASPIWGIFVAILVGLLIQFPTKIFYEEINLIPIVTLSGCFIIDPVIATWATAFGILGGYTVRWVVREKRSWRRFLRPNIWIKIGFKIGVICIPVFLIFIIFGTPTNNVSDPSISIWSTVLVYVVFYLLVHVILLFISFLLQQRPSKYPKFGTDLRIFIFIEGLTLPFVVLTVAGSIQVGNLILFLLAVITIVNAFMMSRLSAAQAERERRGRELSVLYHISSTLRSTIDLDQLLPVIQQQVMQLLEVSNFYIALYDRENQELWYPIAVKFGETQNWARRGISQRLTDRVIIEEKPLLFTPENSEILGPIGLPASDANPTAWLGVPLISSERTIGCLAVFKLEPGAFFTSADTDVLTILSGQVSVAIENALLYQKTQQRTQQLETINQLTAAMTSSLKLDEVLSQVCNSVAQVVGGERSAVYLFDPNGDTVSLAHTYGLEETFKERNASFSIAQSRRARCLRTGKPVIIPSIRDSSLSLDLIQHYKADKIQALADFPLVTPDGQIGFLSVYFSHPHRFTPEETGILQTFASQAALAVANARLHSRTDAALARRVNQLATLEAVGRELSAATHSEQLYSLILEYALEMTNSCCGTVAIYDAETKEIRVKASVGYPILDNAFPVNSGISGRVANTQKIANIPDVSQEPDYIDLRNGETKSQLSVPIIHENRTMGVITLESTELFAYSESEVAFVTQLANQAAINIINAGLYHETQRSLREQSTLYQVSTGLVSAVSPHHVAQTITRALQAILQPQAIGIYHQAEPQKNYQLISHKGNQLPIAIPKFEFGLRIITGADLKIINLDDDLLNTLSQDCEECQVFAFPLEMSHSHPGIVILQLPHTHTLDENQTRLIKVILAQGSIALQNAHYLQEATNGRDRLTAILNSIDEGILMVNIDGEVLLANEPIQLLTGLPLERFLETHLYELPDKILETIGFTQDEVKSLLEALHKKYIPMTSKTVIETSIAQGANIFERFATPVWGQDGQAIGWMLLLRDITEQHKIEQTREAITQTIVHDLRSPMSAIVGALDLLSDCLQRPAQTEGDDIVVQQSLLVAQRSANRVLDLTQSLLEIDRLQSGRLEIEVDKVNFGALISELLLEFTAWANEDSVIIRTQIPVGLPEIQADRNILIRILTNLVDNAIKFTPQGEHITILADLGTDEMLTIQVQDAGPGIPEDYHEKIFERFEQVPGQRPRRRGTGLGLTFCRLAVEAHGGHIWVESSPDGGSVFKFTLPLVGSE